MLALLVIGATPIVSANPAYSALSANATQQLHSSPGALLSAMDTALKKQHSVHVETTLTEKGETLTISSDAGLNNGMKVVSYRGVWSGSLILQAIEGVVYVRGDSNALRNFLDFSTNLARKASGQWISITRSNANYKFAMSGVLFSSIFSKFLIPGVLTPSAKHMSTTSEKMIGGVSAIGVAGKGTSSGVKISITCYIRDSNSPLPVEETGQFLYASGIEVIHDQLGRWNESVITSAPAKSIPLSSLE